MVVTDGSVYVKASSLDRSFSRGRLEQRFGQTLSAWRDDRERFGAAAAAYSRYAHHPPSHPRARATLVTLHAAGKALGWRAAARLSGPLTPAVGAVVAAARARARHDRRAPGRRQASREHAWRSLVERNLVPALRRARSWAEVEGRLRFHGVWIGPEPGGDSIRRVSLPARDPRRPRRHRRSPLDPLLAPPRARPPTRPAHRAPRFLVHLAGHPRGAPLPRPPAPALRRHPGATNRALAPAPPSRPTRRAPCRAAPGTPRRSRRDRGPSPRLSFSLTFPATPHPPVSRRLIRELRTLPEGEVAARLDAERDRQAEPRPPPARPPNPLPRRAAPHPPRLPPARARGRAGPLPPPARPRAAFPRSAAAPASSIHESPADLSAEPSSRSRAASPASAFAPCSPRRPPASGRRSRLRAPRPARRPPARTGWPRAVSVLRCARPAPRSHDRSISPYACGQICPQLNHLPTVRPR